MYWSFDALLKYIDSETFNPAILIQFTDHDSVPIFMFCGNFVFKSKVA